MSGSSLGDKVCFVEVSFSSLCYINAGIGEVYCTIAVVVLYLCVVRFFLQDCLFREC